MAAPREYDIQKEVVKWLRLALPSDSFVCHVPNGGARKVREVQKFKAMGVRNGVPDLLVIVGAHHIPGRYGPLVVWFEVKRDEKQKASPEQETTMEQLCLLGCRCFMISCVEHAKTALEALDAPLKNISPEA